MTGSLEGAGIDFGTTHLSKLGLPNHRHRWLLRAHREWPRRRATEKRDELAPFHSPSCWVAIFSNL
jgi:hypothetical protein